MPSPRPRRRHRKVGPAIRARDLVPAGDKLIVRRRRPWWARLLARR